MASTISTQAKDFDNTSPSTTVLTVFLFYVSVWLLLVIQLLRAQEIWFDPWDILPPPPVGTTAAVWNAFINGPLFLAFAAFVLGGNVMLLSWKMWQTADKFRMVRQVLKLQWIGLGLFTTFIFISRFPIANLWSEPVNGLSLFEYISYNHYIRTAPFILLSFLLFGFLYGAIWRIGEEAPAD